MKGLKRQQKSERVLEVIIRALFVRGWYKITLTKLLKAGLLQIRYTLKSPSPACTIPYALHARRSQEGEFFKSSPT